MCSIIWYGNIEAFPNGVLIKHFYGKRKEKFLFVKMNFKGDLENPTLFNVEVLYGHHKKFLMKKFE